MQNSLSISPLSIGSIAPLDKSTAISGLNGSKVVEPAEHFQSFSETLANALGTVNETMDASDKATDAVVNGTAENLHTSQIMGVKSDILMKMTTTITSKLAQATTQLFQMQV
jgi:flagellar hook-basal body complex protein FliE